MYLKFFFSFFLPILYLDEIDPDTDRVFWITTIVLYSISKASINDDRHIFKTLIESRVVLGHLRHKTFVEVEVIDKAKYPINNYNRLNSSSDMKSDHPIISEEFESIEIIFGTLILNKSSLYRQIFI